LIPDFFTTFFIISYSEHYNYFTHLQKSVLMLLSRLSRYVNLELQCRSSAFVHVAAPHALSQLLNNESED